MADFALVVEGSPFVFTSAGISSVLSYTDAVPTGASVLEGSLGAIDGTLSERLRPLDGTCEVSALDFVLHDADGSITDQFTRTLESAALTYLTQSVTSGATTADVQSAAALGSLPRDVWVAGECWSVTSIAVGNTVNVTRSRYGTTQGAIEVNAAKAELPELLSHPCWLRGRRAKLYRVTGTSAALIWVGYVKHGPALSENGASYTVSCISAWEQEAAATFGSPQSSATLTGYDSKAFRFVVFDGGRAARAESPVWSNFKATVHPTFSAALETCLAQLTTALATAGATDVRYSKGSTGTEWVVTLTYGGISQGPATLKLAGETYVADATTNGGTVEQVWTLPASIDGGAVVRCGFKLGDDNERFTVINPHAEMSSSVYASAAGSRSGTSLSYCLVGDLDDETLLELDPAGIVSPGLSTANTTATELYDSAASGVAVFKARARRAPKDPTERVPAVTEYERQNGIVVTEALPLRSMLKVGAEHWLDGVRAILDDTTAATAYSDSRNWTWTGYDGVRRRSRDDLGAVEYRTTGDYTVGEFVTGEAKLRGCCVSVDGTGRLGIVDVRAPNASETAAASITLADLIAGTVTRYAPSDDGLVTDVVFRSPVRDVTLRDAVALGRYRTQRTLEVSSQSTRRDARLVADPVGYALLACGKLLGRWRNELFLHTLTVAASVYESTATLGAIVSFESYSTPNRSGTRGFTGNSARKGVVIGRHRDLGGNTLELEVLEIPTVYGFAPAARVASIAGAVLTLDTTYAGGAGDYAGSGLTGYAQTANDLGAGWFAAGDKVKLVLRNTATVTEESYVVQSVASGSITLTAAVNTAPTNWPALAGGSQPVDVVFDGYSTALASQRVFAAVGDETTRTIASVDPIQKWAP